jgi:crotonobetainyl-CoA:carnitine CoA-transferase CaiB-like acyl-CoA transferase
MACFQNTEREFNPQIRARNVYIPRDYSAAKNVPLKGPCFWMSDAEPKTGIGPIFGAATDYVYGELLGLNKDEIDRLKKEEVIC